MTALAELQRIAERTIPPVGASSAIATAEVTPCGRLPKPLDTYPNGIGGTTSFGVAWLVDGRIRTRPFVTFERGRDARRLVRLLNGTEPGSRGGLDTTTSAARRAVADPVRPEAPASPLSARAPATCPGCGGPIPPGRHGQDRLTCSPACRQRARRHPAAATGGADTDGAGAMSHLPAPSTAPDHTATPASRHRERGASSQLVLPTG